MGNAAFTSSQPGVAELPRAARCPIALANSIDLALHDRIESLETEWRAAERESPVSVYQRYDWIAAYLENRTQEAGQTCIVHGSHGGETIFILPLAIHGRFVKKLTFIGGSHVNFNLGLFPARHASLARPEFVTAILKRLAGMLPGISCAALRRQPERWQDAANPLAKTERQRAANPAFVIDLSGGFEATLERGNAKRKRKKFRQQCRMAEEAGGYEFIKPQTVAEIDMVLAVFFDQKSQRMRELGIRDVFANDEERHFMRRLAIRSIGMKEPLLQLYALKVGGNIAAVFGAGAFDGCLSGYFSSIETDDFEALSPGGMLLWLIVEDACKAGYRQLDLGAGDERYKRSWASDVIEMYDVILPLTLAGHPVAALSRLTGAAHRRIRENPVYWERYKQFRRFKARLAP